jgi:hypothetical protein
MKVTIAALCEHARERDDGRIDLIGVFHQLHAPGFPAVQEHMTAVFVLEWAADEVGEQGLRADLIGPGGRRILTIEGQTEVVPSAGRAPPQTRLILPLDQVVFPEPGDYTFELVVAGDVLPLCPLHLLPHDAGQARS